MSDRIVRIVLVGEDGVSSTFATAAASADRAAVKFDRLKAAGMGLSSVGRVMTGIAAPAVALGAIAVKSATSFQQAITRISTQTSMSAKGASGIAAHFTQLSGQVGQSSTQLAQGLYPIASEGLKGTKALQALTAAAKGAAIGGDSLTSTAGALSSAMGTNFKDINSASEAMVVMERAAGLGKMTLQDLTDAMGTGVTSEAAGMGLGLRDLGAALGAMTKQGVPAEQEASRLKLSLTKMAAPTGVALKQVQALHMGQFEMARDLRKPEGLIVALQDLQKHIGGLGQNQQNAALANMFGQSRGLSNIRGLLRSLPQMQNIRGGLQSATASQFGARWKEQLMTPAQQFANSLAKVKTAVTNLGNALMPVALTIVPKLASAVSGAVGFLSKMPKPVRDIVVGFTLFLAIGGPTLMLVGKMITSFVQIRKAMVALKIETLATSTVMKASMIGLAVFALVELITHFKQVKQIGGEVLRGLGIMAHAVGRVFSKVFGTIGHVMSGIAHAPSSLLGGLAHSLSFGALSAGGPVKAKYMWDGGPVGSDTVPGWLTPGEYVLNRSAVSHVGMPALNALNSGMGMGGGGNITITPAPVNLYLDSRLLWKGLMHYASSRQARGTGVVGGGMLTGAQGAA
jgi:TP901 family phage tail tape measure protein